MTDSFAGRTITGDINHYTEGIKEQHDPQLLIDALDWLLAAPGVEAVRWSQYTPYFNDGDACVFGMGEVYVKIAGDEDAGDYEDGFLSSYELYDYDKGDNPSDYNGWKKVYRTIGAHDSELIALALSHFERVLDNGHHYVVLNEKFGDPATVTATKDGFEVEYYEHD